MYTSHKSMLCRLAKERAVENNLTSELLREGEEREGGREKKEKEGGRGVIDIGNQK
jgi:hypothetical protein